MAVNGQKVQFKQYTRAAFTALGTKDENAFYVVVEPDGKRRFYLGDKLFTADDSSKLGGELPAYYRNASNLNTGTIPAARIGSGAITNAKMANMSANTIKGRITSSGAPQDLTKTQMLDFLGSSRTSSKFLRGDGTWQTVSEDSFDPSGTPVFMDGIQIEDYVNSAATQIIPSNTDLKVVVDYLGWGWPATTYTFKGGTPGGNVATEEYVDSKTMKLINSGSTTALSKTGYITFAVPSDSYAGKTVAVEIKYGNSSATTYTNQVVYVTLGTSTSTVASKAYPRFVTLTDWDGEYLKHISVKIYVNSGTTSAIRIGHVKTLIGRFTGSTIDWTTQANDNINVYIGKIWLVG